jgi:DNA-binding NarL/FixJ family response regulator
MISGLNTDNRNSIEFFSDTHWDQLTEINITKSLREILYLARPLSKSLHIDLTIRSDDPETLRIIMKKNIVRCQNAHSQKLSSREIEVFNLIVQGFTNKQIATKIFVSFETVRSHRKNILHKTGCANTAMLIDYFHNAFADDNSNSY